VCQKEGPGPLKGKGLPSLRKKNERFEEEKKKRLKPAHRQMGGRKREAGKREKRTIDLALREGDVLAKTKRKRGPHTQKKIISGTAQGGLSRPGEKRKRERRLPGGGRGGGGEEEGLLTFQGGSRQTPRGKKSANSILWEKGGSSFKKRGESTQGKALRGKRGEKKNGKGSLLRKKELLQGGRKKKLEGSN